MTVSIYMAPPPTNYPVQPFSNPPMPQISLDAFFPMSIKLDAIEARLARIEAALTKKPRATPKRKKLLKSKL
jgi:hypothetical protein